MSKEEMMRSAERINADEHFMVVACWRCRGDCVEAYDKQKLGCYQGRLVRWKCLRQQYHSKNTYRLKKDWRNRFNRSEKTASHFSNRLCVSTCLIDGRSGTSILPVSTCPGRTLVTASTRQGIKALHRSGTVSRKLRQASISEDIPIAIPIFKNDKADDR